MTKQEQLTFIVSIFDNSLKAVLDKLDRFPESWDGMELREYIADEFDTQVRHMGNRRNEYKRRLSSYRNERAII